MAASDAQSDADLDAQGAIDNEEALLSDDEKDALMDGVNSGVIGQDANEVESTNVRRFEIRPDAHINYGSFPRLQGICQEMAKRLSVEWSEMLRGPVSVNAEETFAVPYAAAIQKLSAPVLTSTLTLNPLPGHSVLIMDNALLVALVEAFFGFFTGDSSGETSDVPTIRQQFTAGELRVSQIATDRALSIIEPSWEKVMRLTPALVKTEFDPTFGVDIAPKDEVLVCRFLIQTGMHHGYLYLILPFSQVGMIADDLEGAINARNLHGDPQWRQNIQTHLKKTDVVVDVTVGELSLPLRQIISLEVGQVLALSDPEVAELHVHGQRRALGRFGVSEQHNAFRLVEWLPPTT